HRARQSDRRRLRQTNGREGHVPGRQSRHLLRDEEACRRIRHEFGHAGQERPRHRRRAEVPRNLQASRRSGRLRHRSARPVAGGAIAGVHAARAGAVAGRDHPLRHRDRRPGHAHGGQDRLPEAGRLCRFAAHRRQSAKRPFPVRGRRRAPFGHHEGRAFPQEPAALMPQLLFKNFELLEPSFGELRGGYQLLVEGETIRELSDRPIKAAEAEIVDCGGRTLMPGLIDCHVHAIHTEVNVRFMEMLPLTLVTARAATRLRAMLDRGFTTVRDTGGADWGIKTAIETGHITGPRLYIAGQSIGPTGGHSDSRRRTNRFGSSNECVCCNGLQFKSAIADGVDEVRKSAREQMRQGADHVKIMMSGGGASPYDPLDSQQFSDGEVSAAVEEATAFGRYVCAHAYSAESITRAARLGVRTIEHGNLIDDAAAKLMAEKGMFLVANLVTYYAMKDRAKQFGMIGESLAKNEIVLQGGLKSLEICKRHN